MPPAVKEKSKNVAAPPAKAPSLRKLKFQADLAPSEDSMVRVLKAELQMTSNTDFLTDALALFRWAVSERKRGHRIVSESSTGERKILIFPRLERVAPEAVSYTHLDVYKRQLNERLRLISSFGCRAFSGQSSRTKGRSISIRRFDLTSL